MRYTLLAFVFLAVAIQTPLAVWSAQRNYWLEIEGLLKKDTPQGNPELVKYLKSLTKEQLLTALRQYSKAMEVNAAVEREGMLTNAMRILICYAEPLKRSDLSDEEYRKMRPGKQKSLEAGLIPARFTNEAFEKVIAGISNREESPMFRYALLDIFSTKEFYPVLSTMQKDRFLDSCLMVLNDHKSPDMVRSKCINVMSKRILQKEYLQVIYADDVVRKLHDKNTDMQVDSLIRSKKVKLTAKTSEQLEPLRRKIDDLRTRLEDLVKDEREPESLRDEARRQLHSLNRLPPIDGSDG
ncbi:MAG: hypothetical protein ABFC96_13115 [Thermoguttaceae bacterium]